MQQKPIARRMACGILAAAVAAALALSTAAATKEDVLNSAYLDPTYPASTALDTYLDELMPALYGEEDDPYQQVKACYDYLVETVSYGSHMSNLGATIGGVSCSSIYSQYGEIEGFGAVALSAGVGQCNAYNSAFILMARRIGYDARLVEGSTKSGGGSYAYHKWTEIDIDGTTYVFDPQLEQNLVASGMAPYTVFCVTYDEIPGRYIKY